MSLFMRGRLNKRGSLLMLALWTLLILSIFSVQIGLRLRQRVTLISRLEKRSQLRYIAQAGVKKAIGTLRKEWHRSHNIYTPFGKYLRHNNPESFSHVKLNIGSFDVVYTYVDGPSVAAEDRYGFVDEESKININMTDLTTLKRLIENIFTRNTQQKGWEGLAEAIIDWRDMGHTQLLGFYSEDYYANLEFPYNPKNAPFETMDELLLIKGIDKDIYRQLLSFITIYGDGQVNMNTASREVLTALGLDSILIDKIFLVRRGADGMEATLDDHIFQKPFDIASEMKSLAQIDAAQMRALDQLNTQGKIKTNSSVYQIQSRSGLDNSDEIFTVGCIYDADENRIEYWKEKH